jgi:hypothetical protein
MRPCVFIHTNDRQLLGARVSEYSLRRNSARPHAFDVRVLHTDDFEFLSKKEGQPFLRGGTSRVWRMDDLQSFTPLRFMPPALMGHRGRALVIDPDIFAVGDVLELLGRDMRGASVLGRPRSKPGKERPCLASSVMLLECERLTHWHCEEEFDELFRFERDYKDWICLRHEPESSIGHFGPEWNDFDHLSERTRLLHNTKRRTQPWKTGLHVDYVPADKLRRIPPLAFLMRLRGRLFGEYAFLGRYARHPDPNQERFFFGLLRECLEQGVVSEEMLRAEMSRNHVRHDALEVLEETPPLPPPGEPFLAGAAAGPG